MIQEVVRLMGDVRPDARQKTAGAFGQAARDIDILACLWGTKRGQRIEAMEFGTPQPNDERDVGASLRPRVAPRVANSKTGQLRLRVVEEKD